LFALLDADLVHLVSLFDERCVLAVEPSCVGMAGGEWVQNEFHALIGAADAQGWRAEEFAEQTEPQRFGAVSRSRKF
jgi:hypothetical protein